LDDFIPMKTEMEALLPLLRRGLGKEAGAADPLPLDGERWLRVFRQASDQGVLALVWDGVRQLPAALQPPRELRLRWAYNVERIEQRYARQRSRAEELARLFAAEGIRTVVLKGLAVSRLYPVPEHRPCGDLDCFLMGGYERGNRAAEAAGATVARDFYKHSHIDFRGLTVENHRFCTSVRGSRRVKAFERHLQGLLAAAPMQPLPGTELLVPPADFTALFLTRHALMHFLSEGISLRHLCDWAVFIDREGAQVDWAAFREVAAEHDLLRFAEVLSDLSVRCLGVAENPLPADGAALADRVLENILSERRPLFNTSASTWTKRLRLVGNFCRSRWKFREVYGRNFLLELVRFPCGFIFDRHPEL